jgi:hypothetical protein
MPLFPSMPKIAMEGDFWHAQGIGGARSVPDAWQPEAALAEGMERSGTPQSPVFCGAAAKNAPEFLKKSW